MTETYLIYLRPSRLHASFKGQGYTVKVLSIPFLKRFSGSRSQLCNILVAPEIDVLEVRYLIRRSVAWFVRHAEGETLTFGDMLFDSNEVVLAFGPQRYINTLGEKLSTISTVISIGDAEPVIAAVILAKQSAPLPSTSREPVAVKAPSADDRVLNHVGGKLEGFNTNFLQLAEDLRREELRRARFRYRQALNSLRKRKVRMSEEEAGELRALAVAADLVDSNVDIRHFFDEVMYAQELITSVPMRFHPWVLRLDVEVIEEVLALRDEGVSKAGFPDVFGLLAKVRQQVPGKPPADLLAELKELVGFERLVTADVINLEETPTNGSDRPLA